MLKIKIEKLVFGGPGSAKATPGERVLKVQKLVFGGQALGKLDNKACFVWGALPGEEVEFDYTKNKPDFATGIVKNILVKSPERVAPQEDHYLSCSPWQIMNFEAENKWKVEIARETYRKLGNLSRSERDPAVAGEIENLEMITDGVEYGYRNKMEYSFTVFEDQVTLAFHIRESRKYIPIQVCELARPEINKVALELLTWVKENKIPIRSLKTMIVRCNQKGEVLAGLFLKDRLEFDNYPRLKNNLIGLTIYYSTHKSPASVPTAILHQEGQDYLEEDLSGIRLRYGLFSFFQINVPIFKKALADIKQFVSQDDWVVDYYSGVGAIGLPLGARTLVESNPEAVEYAQKNIKLNKIPSEAVCQPSEKMTDLITHDKTIIFDPPRAGLDKRVVEKVLAELPKKIIYLSCDIATQARDLGLLKEKYDIKFLKLYNFFPRTAHIEGLAILMRK